MLSHLPRTSAPNNLLALAKYGCLLATLKIDKRLVTKKSNNSLKFTCELVNKFRIKLQIVKLLVYSIDNSSKRENPVK